MWQLFGRNDTGSRQHKEEAIKAFREDKDYDWMWYEIDDKIGDMYYGENGWMESTVLTANVDTPQVIAENGYSE